GGGPGRPPGRCAVAARGGAGPVALVRALHARSFARTGAAAGRQPAGARPRERLPAAGVACGHRPRGVDRRGRRPSPAARRSPAAAAGWLRARDTRPTRAVRGLELFSIGRLEWNWAWLAWAAWART